MSDLSFCLEASALHEEDSSALTDAIERYVHAGMSTARAQAAAVSDVMATVRAEREQILAAVREQHPSAGQARAPALEITPNGAALIDDPRGEVLQQLRAHGIHASQLTAGKLLVPRSSVQTARQLLRLGVGPNDGE